MPRPIPVPVRQAICQLWQQGQQTHQIANVFSLPRSTIRRLLARFRHAGADGIAPDYHRCATAQGEPSDMVQAALRLRREHPTWGQG